MTGRPPQAQIVTQILEALTDAASPTLPLESRRASRVKGAYGERVAWDPGD